MNPDVGASLPEEERRRLEESFAAALQTSTEAVRREEAHRRDQERPQNQGDQPRGSAVLSPEQFTQSRARAQQHQWATGPLRGTYRISQSSAAAPCRSCRRRAYLRT